MLRNTFCDADTSDADWYYDTEDDMGELIDYSPQPILPGWSEDSGFAAVEGWS